MHHSKRNQMTQIHYFSSQYQPKYSFGSLSTPKDTMPEKHSDFSQKSPWNHDFWFLLFSNFTFLVQQDRNVSNFQNVVLRDCWYCSRVSQGAKNESEHLRCPSHLILGRIWVFGNHDIFVGNYLKPRFGPNRSGCSSFRFRRERLKSWRGVSPGPTKRAHKTMSS